MFKLDKDYQKFDLEVVFSDGTKKNIKRNKIEVGGCLLLYFTYLKSGLDQHNIEVQIPFVFVNRNPTGI